MTKHNHILGAYADFDGNVHYEYESTEKLYPVDVFNFCPECGVNLKELKHYQELDRLDILCGSPIPPPNPCEKCNKTSCRGEGDCKGFGAWSYCVSIK